MMTKVTDESTSDGLAVEELDWYLRDLFSRLGRLKPEDRFQITIPLLKVGRLRTLDTFSDEAILMRAQAAVAAEPGAGAAIIRRVEDIRAKLDVLDLTYLSTNYWSPATDARQSAIACRSDFFDSPSRKRYAIAFFAITAEADRRASSGHKKYWSLAQYLARYAPRPRTIRTVFGPDLAEEADNQAIDTIIRIDDGPGGLPHVNSLADFILSLSQQPGTDDDQMLHECLSKGHPDQSAPWLDSVLNGFESSFETAFRKTLATHRGDSVERLTGRLRERFGEAELTEKRVAFLTAMQVVWRRAFGGNVLYAFPTTVIRECCILTAGADHELPNSAILAGFGRSLFSNQLFLDYGSASGYAARRAFRSFVAHNLPKLVISPATAELKQIQETIRANPSLSDGAYVAVMKKLELLQTGFEHYEALLGRFGMSRARSRAAGFPTRPDNIRFDEDVRGKLLNVFEVLRDRVLDATLREHLHLVINAEPNLQFAGDRAMIMEVLVNLISNSIEAIDPTQLGRHYERAEVQLDVTRLAEPFPAMQFVVRDFGQGIEPRKLRSLNEQIAEFASADEDKWNALVTRIQNSQNLEQGSFERSGIGLPLSIAYLNQPRDDENEQRARGSIEIHSVQSSDDTARTEPVGTRVTIVVPDVNLDRAPSSTPALPTPGSQTPARPRHVAVLTNDERLADRWRTLVPEASHQRLPREASQCDGIIIDSMFLSDPEEFGTLKEMKTVDLMERFRDVELLGELPKSVVSLILLNQLREQNGSPDTLVFLCDAPTPPLIQELLRAGADWICTSRFEPQRVNDIRALLARPSDERRHRKLPGAARARTARPKGNLVLVIENSRSVCLSLRKRLEHVAECYFVGSNLPGNRFRVTPAMAVEAYSRLRHSGRPVAAIISDLALNEAAEATADGGLKKLARDESTRFALPAASLDEPDIHDTIGAMLEIDKLARAEGFTDLPIFFLSDFTRLTKVTAEITKRFSHRENVRAFAKNQNGYSDLEDIMQRTLD